MNTPNEHQLRLLRAAVTHLAEANFSDYLRLKSLLTDKGSGFQDVFRPMFERYYRLNPAGLSIAFKDRYFDLLFGLELEENVDPYTSILRELYHIPRRKGDKALQCSFVSKLVAIHDETYPLFDRHVSNFFGIAAPFNGDLDFRIAGFVANLQRLRETYRCWSDDRGFQEIVSALKQTHPSLKRCADPRLADFLVWTVGASNLWTTMQAESSE